MLFIFKEFPIVDPQDFTIQIVSLRGNLLQPYIMIELKKAFPIPSFEEWEERLKKDLSEEDFGKLQTIDTIEEITLSSHAHANN